MKKSILQLLFFVAILVMAPCAVYAQWPAHVTIIRDEPNKKIVVKGDLKDGSIIGDLSWASNSAVGCFPASQNPRFRGKHVLYATLLGPASRLKITVKPENDSANISLYAYLIADNNTISVVPNLSSCVLCKADYQKELPKKPAKTPQEEAAAAAVANTRTVEFKPFGKTYNVVIGVAGGETVVSGAYTLIVEMQQ